jgi:hypothetical protein
MTIMPEKSKTQQEVTRYGRYLMIDRIVSGGQTGADRAALDVAIRLGYDCGGWVPRGRLDETGVIPSAYPNLVEADDEWPETRTELNVRDSDATVIFSHGPLFGGSEYTKTKVDEQGKPSLHIDLAAMSAYAAVRCLQHWLAGVRPRVLNVAGPRASDDPEIYRKTWGVLLGALAEQAHAPHHSITLYQPMPQRAGDMKAGKDQDRDRNEAVYGE